MIDAVEPEEGATVFLRARRPVRRHRRASSGATMAEFALIAPMGFLLLMSIVVLGIVIANFIQVTNAARDGIRAGAICAGEVNSGVPASPLLPDGTACTVANLNAYINNHITGIPKLAPTIVLCAAGGSCGATPITSFQGCSTTAYLQVTMTYSQPLYLPLVSGFFATQPDGTRTINAQAQAACQ